MDWICVTFVVVIRTSRIRLISLTIASTYSRTNTQIGVQLGVKRQVAAVAKWEKEWKPSGLARWNFFLSQYKTYFLSLPF